MKHLKHVSETFAKTIENIANIRKYLDKTLATYV
jgi:hypothetical protein